MFVYVTERVKELWKRGDTRTSLELEKDNMSMIIPIFNVLINEYKTIVKSKFQNDLYSS